MEINGNHKKIIKYIMVQFLSCERDRENEKEEKGKKCVDNEIV